jgi:hypothetical protein
MRKAGAPIIVIVVPREAAKDNGISSFEGEIPRSRARLRITGNINVVVVR